jgi:multiple sugar transport system permease protein
VTPTFYGRSRPLLGQILVVLLGIFIVLPMAWLAYSAFLPKEQVFVGDALPRGLTFDNFLSLEFDNLLRPLMVSLVASTVVTIVQLVVSLPAAFAIRAGAPLLGVYLVLLAIPAEMLLVPLYGLLQSLGMLNEPLALIAPFLANPFTVFLLYSGLLRLPWAYIEAARIDGASEFAILRKVVAPLLRPELTAAAVLAFAAHWNLVLYPRVVENDKRWWTVQIALSELLRIKPNEWGVLGAAAIVTSLPVIILYLFFERRVTRTIEGGIK